MRVSFSVFGCELWALNIDGIELIGNDMVECCEIGDDDPPFGFHLVAAEE